MTRPEETLVAGPFNAPTAQMMRQVYEGHQVGATGIFRYAGLHGREAHCTMHLIVNTMTGAAFVLVTERDDNPGASVTNCAERIATQLLSKCPVIDPYKIVWVEHYPERGDPRDPLPPSWDRVFFTWDPVMHVFRSPAWRHISQDEAEGLRKTWTR